MEPDAESGAPRAVGVRLRGGRVIKARKAVVSNATAWDTAKMMREEAMPNDETTAWLRDLGETPAQGSIGHLFLGLKGEGMDWSKVDPQHLIIEDWDRPLSDPQNVFLQRKATLFVKTPFRVQINSWIDFGLILTLVLDEN